MKQNSEVDEATLLQRVAAQCGSIASNPKESPVATKRTWSLPGFGPGARVTTAFGDVPVEALRRRDPIKTRDGRFLGVQHLDIVRLDRRYLLTHPDAQPIEIQKDGLAPKIPIRTILMSGAQKISPLGRFDQVSAEIAADYVELGRAERKLHGYFTYYVFHCGERCTVNIDGIWIDLDHDSIKKN
ncbi:Hint domain-containing protein [Jannaschia faecimaris]|uniref:Hint domain-containing protein n=1 Tax=Jannaschia faecimaris TaxID=1244108 RepID=A0A1H3R482_9RHOB|nr:Hint domain-containing protein [Jannaschia faecimaris]SDZ20497.1 Hint domain-containing protein [Jannaschia faecimaris]